MFIFFDARLFFARIDFSHFKLGEKKFLVCSFLLSYYYFFFFFFLIREENILLKHFHLLKKHFSIALLKKPFASKKNASKVSVGTPQLKPLFSSL
jgi:hypothetical protein